ncbi:MAG: response regulator [Planctomycetes bacterium]|nr:response regulator [Planctomycetota bacterium]
MSFLAADLTPAFRREFEEVLQPLGFDLIGFNELEEIKKFCLNVCPPAILLHWRMNNTLPRQVLKFVQTTQLQEQIPTFAVITRGDRGIVNNAEQAGVNSFVLYPLDVRDFLTKLAKHTKIKGLDTYLSEVDSKDRRICVLGQDEKSADILAVYLQDRGFEVDVAIDLREGVTMLSRKRYNVVFLDQGFANRDAASLIASFRQHERLSTVPFIYLLRKPDREHVQKVINAGAFDLILYPLSWDVVLNKVNKIMNDPNLEEELKRKQTPSGNWQAPSTREIDLKASRVIDKETGKVDKAKLMKNLGDLGTLPVMVTKILETVNDPDSSAKSLAKVISGDQALASKILKYANSCFYARRNTVASIDQAVVTLGFEAVKSLAFALKTLQFVAGKGNSTTFDRNQFWYHALATGIISRIISAKIRYPEPEEAFVGGLLHDVGLVIIDEMIPGVLDQIQWETQEQMTSFREQERNILGMLHTDIGVDLVEKWKIPQRLGETIEYHHHSARNLESRGLQDPKLASIVHVADKLAIAMNLGFEGDHILGAVDGSTTEALGLKEVDAEFIREVRRAYNELSSFIFQDIDDGVQSTKTAPSRKRLSATAAVAVITSRPNSISLASVYLESTGWEIHRFALSDEKWPEKTLMVRNRAFTFVETDSASEIPMVLSKVQTYSDLTEGNLIISGNQNMVSKGEGYTVLNNPYDGYALMNHLATRGVVETVEIGRPGGAGGKSSGGNNG